MSQSYEDKLLAQAREILILGKGLNDYKLDGSGQTALEALDYRTTTYARMMELTGQIEMQYVKKKEQLIDSFPNLPEWKVIAKLENSEEGKLYAAARRLMKTIEVTSNNIKTKLIELASDRKHHGGTPR